MEGFKFFGKKNQEKHEDSDEPDLGRRSFLVGAAAAAAAGAALGFKEARATDLPESALSLEDKEKNIELLRRYQSSLVLSKAELADPSTPTARIREIMFQRLPALSEELFKGTELEFPFLRDGFPATLVGFEQGKDTMDVRFATSGEQPGPFPGSTKLGNCFSVMHNGEVILFSNTHMFKESPECVTPDVGIDVSGCPLNSVKELDGGTVAHFENTALQFDDTNASEDLTGQVILIPSVRYENGNYSREIMYGVPVKITPNFIAEEGDQSDRIFPLATVNKIVAAYGPDYISILKNSYFVPVMPGDLNGDSVINNADVQGASGSPVVTEFNCQKGVKTAMGILWGSATLNYNGRSFTCALIHGPEALVPLFNAVDPTTNEVLSNRAEVVKKVQGALNAWLAAQHMESFLLQIDGSMGGHTAGVLANFQRTVLKNVPYKRGVLDEPTWNALFPQEPFIDIEMLP